MSRLNAALKINIGEFIDRSMWPGNEYRLQSKRKPAHV
jgi:hypothetical protein